MPEKNGQPTPLPLREGYQPLVKGHQPQARTPASHPPTPPTGGSGVPVAPPSPVTSPKPER